MLKGPNIPQGRAEQEARGLLTSYGLLIQDIEAQAAVSDSQLKVLAADAAEHADWLIAFVALGCGNGAYDEHEGLEEWPEEKPGELFASFAPAPRLRSPGSHRVLTSLERGLAISETDRSSIAEALDALRLAIGEILRGADGNTRPDHSAAAELARSVEEHSRVPPGLSAFRDPDFIAAATRKPVGGRSPAPQSRCVREAAEVWFACKGTWPPKTEAKDRDGEPRLAGPFVDLLREIERAFVRPVPFPDASILNGIEAAREAHRKTSRREG